MVQADKDWQGELRRTGIALLRDPTDAHALNDRAEAAGALGNWPMAVDCLVRLRDVIGDNPVLLRNLARTYLRVHDTDAALAVMERLVASNPDSEEVETWAVLGAVLLTAGRTEAALDAIRRCEALHGPGHAANDINLATALMRLDRWQEGFAAYERRWQVVDGETRAIRSRLSSLLDWNPRDGVGADLVIGTEQGYGDMIMVARWLPIIAARARRVTFMARPLLLELLEGNFRHISNLRFALPEDVREWTYTHHLMAMSIPHAMGAKPDNLPGRHGYLSAARWAGHRRRTRQRPAVGIVWRGSNQHAEDNVRSIPDALAVSFLVRSPHIDFYALSPPGLQSLRGSVPDNLYYPLKDGEGFEATAAVIEEMDLVISVDSSPCHLAGALGVPVWTLQRREPDWRWGKAAEERTPWYASMTQLRQPATGDWAGLLEQVTARLAGLGARA
ncbi:glycosyltransferase family 9 protein [Niveispirillum sp. KHB5.9]|uniref:glycosyltransferase family 9 protein n=1 Tax=Niveispirillum sp. KHB5.9 TaxID=3400269 RepID=UPI003A895B2C